MANSLVKKITMSQIKDLVGELAQTNHYLVKIPISSRQLQTHLERNYPDLENVTEFVKNKLGFLCSEASLPTTSYATAEVKDNFMGVTQEFAHTRLYTDMDMTFYIDTDYRVLRFFEGWMDFIGGGNAPGEPAASTDPSTVIYRRFNFPEYYKCQKITITKFERDYNRQLVYTFINAFPKGLTSIPVSYGPSDLLKVTVTFNFDRYIVTGSETYEKQISRVPGDVTRAIEEFNKNNPNSSNVSNEVEYTLPGGGIGIRNPSIQ